MSYINLHLETVEIAASAKETAKERREWKCHGADNILVCVWYFNGKLPAFIEWSTDKEAGHKYGVWIRMVGKAMAGVNKTVKNHNPDSDYDLADYICDKLDDYPELVALDKRGGLHVLIHNDEAFFWVTEEAFFTPFLAAFSEILRNAESNPYDALDKLAAQALTDKSKLGKLDDKLAQSGKELAGYKNLFAQTDKLLKAWGLSEETLPLLAYCCCIPRQGKALEKLCAAHKLPQALREAGIFAELFHEIQQKAAHIYSLSFSGYATKELLTATALTLAGSLDVLEYGVYPNGLTALVRVFENDAIEYISLDMYQDDYTYDPEDFGYYDSIENETHYDKVWDEIDLPKLLQQPGKA